VSDQLTDAENAESKRKKLERELNKVKEELKELQNTPPPVEVDNEKFAWYY